MSEIPATLTFAEAARTKVPEAARPASLFFTDAGGNLSRRDPRQPELPLRQVPPMDNAEEAAAS